MTGNELFALIFILVAYMFLLIGMFHQLGGDDILADKFVKFIDSLSKKKDI